MKQVLILGANGQIARLVIERVLAEQADVALTLYLRRSERLGHLAQHPRVTLIEGDIHHRQTLRQAMVGQDLVFISNVDHDLDNGLTQLVIETMKEAGVQRVIAANVLGIYDEVGGAFGRWNTATLTPAALKRARRSDQLLAESGLTYTTLRLPWLNDRPEIRYSLTHRHQPYVGVSGSRASMADVVVKMIENPDFLANDSVGIADPTTEGSPRPVY